MKRFEFPLDKVRQWRHGQAEVEERKLQKLHTDLRTVDLEREQIEGERESAEQIRLLPGVGAQDLANLDTFRQYIRTEILANITKRTQCQVQVDEQRQKLMEARRQFELLDRLRQKALTEWKTAQDKEQEELAGELYLAKRRRGLPISETPETPPSSW